MNHFVSLRVGAGILALALSAAACGKIPDPGAGADGAPAVGEATLTVLHDDGTPVGGAQYVHTRADGTFVDDGMANDTGGITITVTDGDVVHVGFMESSGATGQSKRLYTIAYIQAGDSVTVNNHSDRNGPSNQLGTLVVGSAALPAGATSGTLRLGCTEQPMTGSATTVQFYSDCVDDRGKFSIVAEAINAQGVVVGTATAADQTPPTAGQSITVNLSGWSTNTTPNVALVVQNVPGEVLGINAQLDTYRSGMRYQSFEFSTMGPVPPEMYSISIAPGHADALQYNAGVAFPGLDANQNDGVLFLVTKQAYVDNPSTNLVADFGTSLPRLHAAIYDSANYSFAWTTEVADDAQQTRYDQADVVFMVLSWNDDMGNSNLWQVLAPGGRSSPQVYQLHALSPLAPPAEPGSLPVFVGALSLDTIDGYHDVKNRFGTGFLEGGIDTLPTFVGSATFSGSGPK